MAKHENLNSLFTGIANAIRSKTGSTDPIVADDFPTEIEGIESGSGGGDDVSALLDDTLTEINSNVTKVVNSACRGRTALVSVNLPNATSIGEYSFNGCSNIETFNAPNVTSFGLYAFYKCLKLKEVNFPKVTGVTNNCFYGSAELEKADFGSASIIASKAFTDCPLYTLILRKTDAICTLANTDAMRSTKIYFGTGYIYVPKALIEDYKVATNWSDYAAQFRAIEDYPEICGG